MKKITRMKRGNKMRGRMMTWLLLAALLITVFPVSSLAAWEKLTNFRTSTTESVITVSLPDGYSDKGYYKLFWQEKQSDEIHSAVLSVETKTYEIRANSGSEYSVALFYARTKGSLPAKWDGKLGRTVTVKAKTEPVTVTPTATPTAKPTAAPEVKKNDFDVPDALDYIGSGFVRGEFAEQSENIYFSNYLVYSYDNWSDSQADVTGFLNLFDGKTWPFVLVGTREEDFRSTSASIRTYYYYRYTGSKKVNAVLFRKSDDTQEAHMRISVNRWYLDDKTTISISLVPGLVYGGKDRPEGDSGHQKEGGSVTPVSRPATKIQTPCIKCHGNREVTCTQCNGSGGKWIYVNSAIGGNSGRHWENCFKCKGSGKITCPRCHGTGKE